ncbi:hypothetical protein I6E11_11595 [Bacteroides caecigallinarum]|uniref:hypothetical protein n=1 Tax=Bacteroides caecigallinarum TaxID=1411144 RepID=UPI001F22E606|nr:hypothetical protein [Bacteroides caecigallinarum]MCF2594417.1 hypothetical protein [Bacteroides caecigallinarum]
MAVFFSIMSEGVLCLFYGMIITAFIMATLYFILSSLSNGAVRSVAFFVTGPVLALLLVVNMTLLVGAITVKGETESMRLWLMQRLDGVHGIADIQCSQQVGDMLNEHFPLSGCFLNLFDMSGHRMEELPQVFYEVINDEMNKMIWSSSLWSLAFIVAAMLVALYFDKGENNPGKGKNKRQVKRVQTNSRRNFDDF